MNSAANVLRLGTRGSLLAVAQSRQIARALEEAHPGLTIQLHCLSTRGDRDQSTPLASVRDAQFFSDTLDSALQAGDIDFCVHSRKDLADQRPAGLRCAAMPARANPRDVVLFRADVMQRLHAGMSLRIGSSSQRRQLHVRDFLNEHLPAAGQPPSLQFRSLRGAVEQRARRLTLADDDSEALDGVVLALAGLERLWQEPEGRKCLATILEGARWMVLPLSECPAAPGQGALSLECRSDDLRCAERLNALHDPMTEALVAREFSVASGNTPAFAATAVATARLGTLVFQRNEQGHRQLLWDHPPRPAAARPWDGAASIRQTRREALPIRDMPQGALFIAHWHALPAALSRHGTQRIWVSGVKSWRQLAARGYWVEGCADNLGFESIQETLQASVLQLPEMKHWTAVTRDGAQDSWSASGVGSVLATYRSEPVTSEDNSLAQATHCFWGSGAQFRALGDLAPRDAEHACGNGKTAAALRELGIQARIFPSRKEWRAWLG
jgi:hydroxymethylbilane synthase